MIRHNIGHPNVHTKRRSLSSLLFIKLLRAVSLLFIALLRSHLEVRLPEICNNFFFSAGDLFTINLGMLYTHSSPRRLTGEKNVPVMIIAGTFFFSSQSLSPEFTQNSKELSPTRTFLF